MKQFEEHKDTTIRDSIVVSIPACHAGDRGSIPRLGVIIFLSSVAITASILKKK